MGNIQFSSVKLKLINFEDIQYVLEHPDMFVLINTLPSHEQDCLIQHTIPADKEESIINQYMQLNKDISIVLYGRNSTDNSVLTKYKKLVTCGFIDISLYSGGLFEWLMMQDIFGFEDFPTTKEQLDFLKYKSVPKFNIRLLGHTS